MSLSCARFERLAPVPTARDSTGTPRATVRILLLSSLEPQPELKRALGPWDTALLTIGSVLGTAIFLTPAQIAAALPHAGLILLLWMVGGLLTLAGALTLAEMGAMFPRAGGLYHYLKEAYGPLPAFLFGWVSFFVIMSGGVAAVAAGFGEYFGYFVPFFSNSHRILSVPVGAAAWTVTGGQLAAAAAIVFFTAVNIFGVREGAIVQNFLTVLKVGSLTVFVVFGLFAAAPGQPRFLAPPPQGPRLSAFGVALIAVLWAYDGWYNATFSAGELRDPGRTLPRGLLAGTVAIVLVYVVTNVVYLRALSLPTLAASPRVAEAAAVVLFGPGVARLVTLAIAVAMLGCLSANVLACSRIYQPMAADGLFFAALARIEPRHAVPRASLIAQGIWATVLVLTGTFEQLFTYVIFIEVVLFCAAGTAIFVLRRRRPEVVRPYRVWGYPLVPAFFIAASLGVAANTLFEKPVESLAGLGFLAAGLPAYALWRGRSRRRPL
jgi:APA family basic amino acid/polyamine antiporter